jgi:hypothetical protein
VVVVAEQRFDAFAFAGAQQAVVDEHAVQSCADRAVDEHRRHRTVDTARQAHDHFAILAHQRGFTAAILVSTMLPGFQSVRHFATPSTKFWIMRAPSSVCATSGWNCSP